MKNSLTNFKIDRLNVILILAMLYVTIDLVSNVLVLKVVKIGFFLQPGSIFIYPILFLIADVLAEVYGYAIAKLVVIFDMVCDLIFAIVAYFSIKLPSPSYWHNQDAFNIVLGHLVNMNIEIVIAILMGSVINIYLITKWRILLKGRYFWLRSIGSSAIGQGFALSVAAFFIYHKTLPPSDIIRLILSDYAFRMLYAVIGAAPASFLVAFLKVVEASSSDEASKNTDVNPLKTEWN